MLRIIRSQTVTSLFGFICGIVSQDYDLQEMYLDSFLTIGNITDDLIVHAIEKLDIISEKYGVKFVLSVSKNEADLPESAKARTTDFVIKPTVQVS